MQSTILAQAASKLILKLGLQILFSFPFALETRKVPKRRLMTDHDIAMWNSHYDKAFIASPGDCRHEPPASTSSCTNLRRIVAHDVEKDSMFAIPQGWTQVPYRLAKGYKWWPFVDPTVEEYDLILINSQWRLKSCESSHSPHGSNDQKKNENSHSKFKYELCTLYCEMMRVCYWNVQQTCCVKSS